MNYHEFCNKYQLSLNREQEEAVKHNEGPTLLIAVPGSGKTTVIIARIACLIFCRRIPPDRILTVTFSVEAAESMKARFFRKFGREMQGPAPEFRTIHSLALDIIKVYCRREKKIQWKILEHQEEEIRKAAKQICGTEISDPVLKELVKEISFRKSQIWGTSRIRKASEENSDFSKIFLLYEEKKKAANRMDFDDILAEAFRILENNPEILAFYQNKYEYFNVDEAQDNSPLQNQIMALLSSRKNNLFLVGDEDQCIYGFRGADPKVFLDFSKKWGEENVRKLETNYRSRDEILQSAEAFITRNKNRYPKRLRGVRGGGGSVKITDHPSCRERDRHIMEDAQNYHTAAVLSRNNDSLIPVAHSLLFHQRPFNFQGGRNKFFDFFAVQDVISVFRAAIGENSEAFSPQLTKITENRDKLVHLSQLTPSEGLLFLLDEMYYGTYLISKARDGYAMESLCGKWNVLASVGAYYRNIKDFLNGLAQLKTLCKEGSSGGKISLMTCHGAKGLEFEKVYLVDVIDRTFPVCYNNTVSDRMEENQPKEFSQSEEEARLFYVALTRGMEEVEIMNLRQAEWGDSTPSVFVEEIKKEKERKEGER